MIVTYKTYQPWDKVTNIHELFTVMLPPPPPPGKDADCLKQYFLLITSMFDAIVQELFTVMPQSR